MPLLLLALLAVASSAAPNSCRGQPNTLPFIPGTETVKARAPNGVLTEVKGVTPPLLVVHVYGNATQRGHAYGALLKPFLAPLLSQFWAWMDSQVEEIARFAPAWLVDVLVTEGARAALDLQFAAMYPWISSEFLDEVHAAAKAAGVEHADLLRLQMVPELVKAHCSMVGAWDAATPSGKLVQLRALDWAMNSPLQQWPLVTVYHTSAHSAFSTLGWPGFMGALTGMSSAPVGVCEKVWLSYDGSDSRFGLPFNLLLRDILEFDTNTEAAIARITKAKRTCSIWVGVGSPAGNFSVISYAPQNVTVYNASNLEVGNHAHPQLPHVVYLDKHKQPSSDPCLGSLLQDLYGKIDAAVLVRNVTAQLATGDTHLAVYDYEHMQMLVSNASPYVGNSATPAYQRAVVQLNMAALFARTAKM